MNIEIDTLNANETWPIRQVVFAPDQPVSQSVLEEDTSGQHFGLRVEGRLVAVASLFVAGTEARLRKLAVLGDYRNLGLGTRLVDHVSAQAQAAAVARLWCRIRVPSLPFYQRLGFVEIADSRHRKGTLTYCHIERHLAKS